MPCDSGPGPSDWDRMYAKLNDSTRVACELAKMLTLEQLKSVSRQTAEWISEHWKLDKERDVAAKCEQERLDLAAKARNKLTEAEREALGVR